jgi:hypothetical protein
MPLTAGARLGPYQILVAIGAGGMGEVYRAREERARLDTAAADVSVAIGAVLKQCLEKDPDSACTTSPTFACWWTTPR